MLISPYSLHWYLAIICNPEHVLEPPTPAPIKTVSSIQTRKRKRDSQNTDAVELPSVDSPRMPPELPVDTREPTPARSRSIDEADETSVEALLDVGACAISPGEENRAESLSKSSSPIRELSGENGGLLYPPSDYDHHMEIDGEVFSADASIEHEVSPDLMEVTSRPASAMDVVETDDKAMDLDAEESPSTSTIPASRFYGSKGKQRALSPAVPHPLEIGAEELSKEEFSAAEPSEAGPSEFDSNK